MDWAIGKIIIITIYIIVNVWIEKTSCKWKLKKNVNLNIEKFGNFWKEVIKFIIFQKDTCNLSCSCKLFVMAVTKALESLMMIELKT